MNTTLRRFGHAFILTLLGACASAPSSSEGMIVEFPVNPETRAEFIDALNVILVDTRAYDGCLGVTVWTHEAGGDFVWLHEEWASRAHQEAYQKWRTDTGNTSHLGPFITGTPRFLWLNEH